MWSSSAAEQQVEAVGKKFTTWTVMKPAAKGLLDCIDIVYDDFHAIYYAPCEIIWKITRNIL
jgi:hypothetical protein